LQNGQNKTTVYIYIQDVINQVKKLRRQCTFWSLLYL